jgi:hypothetical protein
MKNSLLLAFLFISAMVSSQKNETKRIITIEGNDTTIIDVQVNEVDAVIEKQMKISYSNDENIKGNKRIQIFIDTIINNDVFIEDSNDSMRVLNGKKNVYIFKNEMDGKSGAKIIIDGMMGDNEEFDFDFDDDKEENVFSNENSHWSGIGLSVMGLLNADNKFMLSKDAPFMTLDYTKTYAVNFNVLEKSIPIYKEYIGFTTGLGFNWNHYGLKNNVDLNKNNDSIFGTTNTNLEYTRNALRSTYLQIPLLLDYNSSANSDKSWHLTAGVVGGFRLGANWKTKWEDNGKKNSGKIKDDFFLTGLQANALVMVGYGNTNLFVQYSLKNMFQIDKGPALRPVSLGVFFDF